MSIRVFVSAPTPMAQAGLRTMLDSETIHVVGESARPEAFGEALPGLDAIVVADDLLLEDIGREFEAQQPEMASQAAVVALTNNGEAASQILRAAGLRGWGVVPLDAPAAQLQAAITSAAQGLIVFHPTQVPWLHQTPPRVLTSTLTPPDEALTSREREVLELVSEGLSNKLIARQLQISEHTVKFHVASVSAKLGASSRTDAVSRGLRRGLITL